MEGEWAGGGGGGPLEQRFSNLYFLFQYLSHFLSPQGPNVVRCNAILSADSPLLSLSLSLFNPDTPSNWLLELLQLVEYGQKQQR